MRIWLTLYVSHTHTDWVSSRAVECKQVSYGRECTISRSFPSPLQQALLYHTSAVSTASEDYWKREKGERVGEGGRERLSKRVGKESRVWNWNLHSPYVPSKLWLLLGRLFFFSFQSISPLRKYNQNIMYICGTECPYLLFGLWTMLPEATIK